MQVYNIIVVFRELRLTELLRQHVHGLLAGLPPPIITEIPNQLLALAFPDHQIECQFANRRLEVRDRRGQEVGRQLFCEIAVAALAKVKESGSQDVNAYGLNYDVVVPVTGHDRAGAYVSTYIGDLSRIEGAFGGSVTDVGIKATIEGECEINLSLEALPDRPEMLKAHVNYHFASPNVPADAQSLQALIQRMYEALFRALRTLPG